MALSCSRFWAKMIIVNTCVFFCYILVWKELKSVARCILTSIVMISNDRILSTRSFQSIYSAFFSMSVKKYCILTSWESVYSWCPTGGGRNLLSWGSVDFQCPEAGLKLRVGWGPQLTLLKCWFMMSNWPFSFTFLSDHKANLLYACSGL